jgi:Fic family protein
MNFTDQLDAITITPQMLAAIAELDEFKGAWNSLQYSNASQLDKLKKVSSIGSIGSSNRIEGNTLSDAEVEELLSGLTKKSFSSRDEEEVAGYAELLDLIFENYEAIPLSENYIKQMHKILLNPVEKDSRHRGNYKKLPNSVAAYDKNRREIGIVFKTAEPFETPVQMERLVAWTAKNLEERFFHPLIITGIFVVVFLAIHPFQDGNGRLSRALTTLLLLKSGYKYIPYSSLESIIELNKDAYYRTLRHTQNTLGKKANYESWLGFFLGALQKQKRYLEEQLKTSPGFRSNPDGTMLLAENSPDYAGNPAVSSVQAGSLELSRLAGQILSLFTDHTQLSVEEISTTLGSNINTVKKTVQKLSSRGLLVKHGVTRGAWYEQPL